MEERASDAPFSHLITMLCEGMEQEHLIFLSYASPDRAFVEGYYAYLTGKGLNIWMDSHNIRGGQNWDFELKKALKKSSIIVVFLSKTSVNKRGYVQREIRMALDQAQEKLFDDIYIIPVAIDSEAAIPDQLEHIHVIKSDKVDGFDEVHKSISQQLKEFGNAQFQLEEESGLSWFRETLSEAWDGLPGYEFSHDILRMQSKEYPEVSKVTDILRGEATSALLAERRVKLEQAHAHHNFGQGRYQRQNSYDAHCREPIIIGRILSIIYDFSFWYAGAAHPNHGHFTRNFIIDPLIFVGPIVEVFSNPLKAFEVVQSSARRMLLTPRDDGNPGLDEKWVTDGTKEWSDFETYAFTKEGMVILFGPYHVGPYAAGSHSVTIPFAEIVTLLKKEIAAALGIEYLAYQPRPFGADEHGSGGEEQNEGRPE